MTALAALVVGLQPSWLSSVARIWLVVVALLAAGAIISEFLANIPEERRAISYDSASTLRLGEVRQMRDIESANDFLIAVDYQLFPFLQGALTDVAAHRLLIHHNVVLERDPDRARHLLGNTVWQLVRPVAAGDSATHWGTVTNLQLAAATDALEKL
ncbi:MAG TPA: hypothetical protein VIJ58_10785 [Candidatus Dormibacteraeota bacterium]